MQIQERIDYFTTQSYDDKKQQVFSLLETIQDKHPTLKELYTNLTQLTEIPEDLLVEVYTDILNLEQIILEKGKNAAMEKFEQANIRVKQLREQEAADRVQENPEGNLDQALLQL